MPQYSATTLLRKEHDAILRMLDVAVEVARQLGRKESVPPKVLEGLLEFFQVFADQCHHGKEEALLFPALQQKGLAKEGGPVGVMLHEHEVGRSLIRDMREAGVLYGQGSTEAGKRWASAALAYAELLRQHIFKENNVLFRIAEQVLTESEQQDLARAFEKLEVEKMGAGTHERLHVLMDRLTAEVLQRQG